ncbi:MAG: hypothetical protein Q8S12_04165 [Hydrogenophaga sp.]|uniref:hypothetical protein n=1 Tax=Hydrogenophaga sp. TaxID=1904254 RepID=UPI00273356BE|nr:hypothetical protein [Hydrogenophaga sp.]MDP3625761.1 hypothetical protein [Hydrogenophaga sp.]
MNRYRLGLLADYLAATRNEIDIDNRMLRTLGMDPMRCGHIPRVQRWAPSGLRRPCLWANIARLARLLWPLVGAPLLFTLQAMSLWRAMPRMEISPRVIAVDHIGLGFSSRAMQLIRTPAFDPAPACWLVVPWVSVPTLPSELLRIDLMEVLSAKDLRDAWLDAMAATLVAVRRRDLSQWILQTYTALRWFAARRAVDRLGGTLYTAEHYDRWAVLADRAVRRSHANNHSPQAEGPRGLVLVQHGVVVPTGNKPDTSEELRLSTRLSRVDALHAFDDASETFFRLRVLTIAGNRRLPNVKRFVPNITLSATGEAAGTITLLFVGHPFCEELHLHALAEIQRTMPNVATYYKPHPLAAMSPTMAAAGWQFVKDSQFFPAVDLLISYPSTLVVEYEAQGIRALVHPINMRSAEAQPFLYNLSRELARVRQASSQ